MDESEQPPASGAWQKPPRRVHGPYKPRPTESELIDQRRVAVGNRAFTLINAAASAAAGPEPRQAALMAGVVGAAAVRALEGAGFTREEALQRYVRIVEARLRGIAHDEEEREPETAAMEGS